MTILTALALSACDGPTAREVMDDELAAQRHIAIPFPSPNNTYISFDIGHGYQIEYLGANQRAYLWYPGNRRVVAGDWQQVLDEMCFRYGPETYNPQTRQRGGFWNCTAIGELQNFTVGVVEGDPFGLQTGRVPYVRSKCGLPEGIRLQKQVSCTP